MSESRRWYTIADAADHLGLKSTKTLYSLIARDRLPAGSVLRIGRQLRLDVGAIETGLAIGRRP